MYDSLPISLFEHVPFGVIISDKENTVRYLNKTAGELLGCERWAAIGSPCWDVMPLRTREDAIFCSYDCPVLVAIEADERSPRQWGLRCSRRGFSADIDVLTIPDPVAGSGRYCYLH
ncbi:MAG: PAS domain-containing protein, partial [Candidatus Binatia bacterium]